MKKLNLPFLFAVALLVLTMIACKDKDPKPYPTKKVNLLVEAKNFRSGIYKFYYNNKKQVTSVASYPAYGTMDSIWMEYNAQGLVIRSQSLRSSTQIVITYDNQNRVIKKVGSSSGIEGTPTIYTYTPGKVITTFKISPTLTDSTVYTVVNGNVQTAYQYTSSTTILNKRDNQEFDDKPSLEKMLPPYLWAIPYVMPNKNNLKKFRYEHGDMGKVYQGISAFTYNDTLVTREEYDYRFIDLNMPSPTVIEYIYEKR